MRNSVKNEGCVTEVVLCTASDDVSYLYQVSKIYLKGYMSYLVDTISRLKLTKGHSSVKM